MRIMLPAIILALLCACGPTDTELEKAFLDSHPGAEVYSVMVGEGADKSWVIVKYRMPGETEISMAELLCRRGDDGRWVLTDRGNTPLQTPDKGITLDHYFPSGGSENGGGHD